ncbi:MAG TPA: M20/M25/M40 family metallo-hydrolase [Phycisphaerae bacterium]|nr:M20/M25/M40 family metallo-hydrolase [Phycisphaerae bacterium]
MNTKILLRSVLALAVVTGLGAALVAFACDDNPTTQPVSKRYEEQAKKIIDAALAGNDAWKKMEELCDGIGHRLSGSEALDKAVAWAVATMKADGQENVRAEPVMVPKWVRGEESLTMVEPYRYPLVMSGLGLSVGTPTDGLTADVLVVADEKELEAAGDKARGRIVLFNNPMQTYDPNKGSGYGTAVRFRHKGAVLASAQGATACLVRSVTARSLRSPHTGAMSYADAKEKIPAAAISTEDAEMICRLAARGQAVKVTLKMGAQDHGMVPSANVVGELRGREHPEEIVVIGGHIDSWDAGQGAHDDGAGCVIAMEAINVLRKLNMIPQRTIRVVLWTNEENGLAGGKQYAKDHEAELAKHVAAIESDSGAFRPEGYSVECLDGRRQTVAAGQLVELMKLLSPLGRMDVSVGHSGADISPMKPGGVVLMGFDVEGSKYFDYHHTHADTLDKVNPQDLSQCVASMAVTAYVIAEMPERLGE